MPRAQNNNNNPVSPRSHSPQTPLSLRVHSSFRNILKNGRLRLPSSADPSLVERGRGTPLELICISHGDRLSSYDATSFELIMIPAPHPPYPSPHAREGLSLADQPGLTASLDTEPPKSLRL